MAKSAEKLIYQHYSNQIPVEIETVKEPESMTTGTASGIM
jgi:hypothetical protein